MKTIKKEDLKQINGGPAKDLFPCWPKKWK